MVIQSVPQHHIIELTFKYLQIVLVVSISLIPIYYHNHSIFVRRGKSAIDDIAYVNNYNDPSGPSRITQDRSGFSELCRAIKSHSTPPIYSEIVEIGHVFGHPHQLEEFFEPEIETFSTTESVVYAVCEDGTKRMVLRRSPSQLLTDFQKHGAIELAGWLEDTAKNRANRITAGLVITWSTISSYLVL